MFGDLLNPTLRQKSSTYDSGITVSTRLCGRDYPTGGAVVKTSFVVEGFNSKTYSSNLSPNWTPRQLYKRLDTLYKKALVHQQRLVEAQKLMNWVDTNFNENKIADFVIENEPNIGTSEYENMTLDEIKAWREALTAL